MKRQGDDGANSFCRILNMPLLLPGRIYRVILSIFYLDVCVPLSNCELTLLRWII